MKRFHSAGGKEFNPETLALGLGYDPRLSEGSVKPPVFLTSTFVFSSAAEGKQFFELAYGLREADPGEEQGLIYSRLNNPNLQIFEERLAAWDRTERAAAFASGMAAISTSLLAVLKPGDHLLATAPVYGGTYFFFENILPRFGVHVTQVLGGPGAAERLAQAAVEIGEDKVRVLYIETPSNPSNALTDIAAVSALGRRWSQGRERGVLTMVDNTFLGPLFQRPALHGADLVIYSATKFIGGHSDLIAGVVSGSAGLIGQIATMRTILGTMCNPFTGWMLLRSLETLSIRMRRQAKTARLLVDLLAEHPKVRAVHYPGRYAKGSEQHALFERQCTGAGSLIAFEVEGGEAEAFAVLDAFEVFKLAVSLGGTESLVEHPASMTHADIPLDQRARFGVGPAMIRMSVGIEHHSDLLRDLRYALDVLGGEAP